ncbi:MAG: hypothetical protein VB089_14735 [Anaerolineaceae bacterium]|nr:hypothetical protein [Anaerolineaceae bacterium]
MRSATRIAAMTLGLLAGVAGLEHGYFEILQGNVRPQGLLIVSIGPPCVPQESWNGCEPALTILPSFLISGILTVVIALAILGWSAAGMSHRRGGVVLLGLSVALLLSGGGIFPPLIGAVGGVAGLSIHTGRPGKPPGGALRRAAKLWPWPLVVLAVWSLAQFPIGYFFNHFLQSIMGLGLLLILVTLAGSIYTAYARDTCVAVERSSNVVL